MEQEQTCPPPAAYVDLWASVWATWGDEPDRRLLIESRVMAVPPGLAGYLLAVSEATQQLASHAPSLAALAECRPLRRGLVGFTVEVTDGPQTDAAAGNKPLPASGGWHELLFFADCGPLRAKGGPTVA